jgi:hypothetical protein
MTTTATPEVEGMTYTARRVWHGKKAIVQVLDADGDVWAELGGNRAERAKAAVMVQWPHRDGPGKPGVYGLRQDLHAAEVEAHRLVHATQRTGRPRFGGPAITIPLNTATWAIAVPVADESDTQPNPKETDNMATLTADKQTEKEAEMAKAAEGDAPVSEPKAETTEPKAKRGATVTWTIEGAPPAGKTTYHLARLALQCTSGIVEGKKHISVAELRKLLADGGITDPEHTTWSFTLPNGKTIGAIAEGEPVPEAKFRRTEKAAGSPDAKKAAGSKRAADRIATLSVRKAAAKAARESGQPIPDERLSKMTVEECEKVTEARTTKKAPAAKKAS